MREFLRTRYPRADSEHGDAWTLTPDQAETALTHFASDADATAADALYADWRALYQEFRYRLLAAGTKLRDLLDAQGLAWWLTSAHPPRWLDGRRACRAGGLRPRRSPRRSRTLRGPPPVTPAWNQRSTAGSLHLPSSWLSGLVDMLEEKQQVILYGPPGTGKTFIAQHLGKHIADHGGGYRLVQFHPSYTSEDFLRGINPSCSTTESLALSLSLVHCGKLLPKQQRTPPRHTS